MGKIWGFLGIGVALVLSSCFAFADESPTYPRVEALGFSYFNDHYQTVDGHNVYIPSFIFAGNFGLTPRFRIELRQAGGASKENADGFKASINDLETRFSYRMDDLKALDKNGPLQHFYGWLSWRIWDSDEFFNAGVQTSHEEGIGFGVTRSPSPSHALSYFYSFGLYPSVRVKVGQAVSRISVEMGPTYQLAPYLTLFTGVRFQTLLTSGVPHQRAQEQGVTVGLRGTF